jgi:hypothetical protein
MPADIKYNLITFRLNTDSSVFVYLTGGTVTRRGGLQPDVWTFIVPYSELAKLSLADVSVEVSGVVELWYSLAPATAAVADVVLGNVAIVDIQPNQIDREPGDTTDKVISYQVAIADHRRAFVEPRGGRLFDGLLNRYPLPGGDTLLTNQQLMQKCATAMGVTLTVGTGVNDAQAMRDVDWRAAHAPTALQELLEHTGHVYAPLISGHAQVMLPGAGTAPTVPGGRLIRTVTSKSVDRRPTTVIFLSAPAAKILTYNKNASPAPTWKYVIQDPADDQWKPLADVTALTGGAATVWSKQFENLSEAHKGRIREQLYCCIQLDPVKFPPGKVVLLPKWFDTSLVERVPSINETTTLLVQDATGSFGQKNNVVSLLARQVVSEANVLIFPHPLMKLATANTSIAIQQLNGTHVPFPEAEIKPNFSVEAWDEENDRREYAVFGFNVASFSVSSMTESAAKDQLTGYRPNVCVYNQPDLQQVTINPGGSETTNRTELQDRAETYARQVVRLGTPAMQVMTIKGFLAVELTGTVSEVSYDRESVTTTLTLNGWNVTARIGNDSQGGGGVGDSTISSGTTRQQSRGRRTSHERSRRRLSRIGTDSEKMVEPARGKVVESVWPQLCLATEAEPIAGEKGRYTGKLWNVKVDPAATGNLTKENLGEAFGECEIWHLPEASTTTTVLREFDLLLCWQAPTHTTRGKPIVVTLPNQLVGGTFVVKLAVAAGTHGTNTTTPSYTYNVQNLNGTQIAAALSPLAGREIGYFNSAGYGLAYFDTEENAIKLLRAFETRSTTECPE